MPCCHPVNIVCCRAGAGLHPVAVHTACLSLCSLARPRRFGKSLLIDTLAELFAGNEPLFRGLAIHPDWDWRRRYPVVRLSFGGGVLHSREALAEKSAALLSRNERYHGVSIGHGNLAERFYELIATLHQQTGERVVVLVDEYDKPILDNITDPEIAREMRDGLRNLYSVIKEAEAHIQFALLTGVSKFSKVSIFSGLNNLRDITVSADYSALCGYTEADLDQVFAPELEGLDREAIRGWYNGYNWTGEAVDQGPRLCGSIPRGRTAAAFDRGGVQPRAAHGGGVRGGVGLRCANLTYAGLIRGDTSGINHIFCLRQFWSREAVEKLSGNSGWLCIIRSGSKA